MTKKTALVFAAFAVALPALADEAKLPERKAGFWELKTTMDEGRGPHDSTIKMCIDATMEANTVKASDAEHKTNCEQYEVKKTADATVVEMSCKFNERHVTSKTEMSGDFTTAFNVKIESTTSDAAPNGTRTIVIKRTITQEGKYLGDSCGDVQPGQAMAPDGTKVMVQ